jgi:glutamine amidotransferase-like uncharacterized protein
MSLNNVMKSQLYYLLPFIGISYTLNGATKSPSERDVTQPPSIHASQNSLILDEKEERQSNSPVSVSSTGRSPGLSSRFTSIGTTPQLSASPPPEVTMPDIASSAVRSPNCSHSDNSVDLHSLIRVFVYHDDGVMPNSQSLWEHAFAVIEGNFKLSFITAAMILDGKLSINSCDLLIVPGGRATPFHEKLQAMGKQKIKDFANQGGKCLGVGAGAYFLSSKSQFFLPGSTLMEREGVGLTDITASGPFSPVNKTKFSCGESAFQITYVQEKSKPSAFAFCNGGCFFKNHDKAIVIAQTQSGDAVVVKENDNIILSGVHPEFSEAHWIPDASPFHKAVLTQASHALLICILKELSLL